MTDGTDRLAPFLRQVALRNYESIAQCHVRLKSTSTFLVGRTGAGKSNVLDSDGSRTVPSPLSLLRQALP